MTIPPEIAEALAAMTPTDVNTVLASIGANVERLPDTPYALAGIAVRLGLNAFNVNTFISANGIPTVGQLVVNMFPDGNGDLPQDTDGSGVARFQYGASSAFTTPGSGPFTVFATDQAVKTGGAGTGDPPRVTFGKKMSDVVHSLGDFGGQHTEIYLQFVERGAFPPPGPDVIPVLAEPLNDSLRILSWNRRGIDFNKAAALFLAAQQRQLGFPLSNEFNFDDASGKHYVAQMYFGGIVFCEVGHYDQVSQTSWLG